MIRKVDDVQQACLGLEATSCLAHDYPEVARNMEAGIWLFRRIDERRRPTTSR